MPEQNLIDQQCIRRGAALGGSAPIKPAGCRRSAGAGSRARCQQSYSYDVFLFALFTDQGRVDGRPGRPGHRRHHGP